MFVKHNQLWEISKMEIASSLRKGPNRYLIFIGVLQKTTNTLEHVLEKFPRYHES